MQKIDTQKKIQVNKKTVKDLDLRTDVKAGLKAVAGATSCCCCQCC